jgi:hypothetical protein
VTRAHSRAVRREWIGLAVLTLPALLASMDLSVLFMAAPWLAADLRPTGPQLLWIMDAYGFLMAGLLLTMGALGDRIGMAKTLYATERPDTLYLTFEIEFTCTDITGEGRREALLRLKGDGSYNARVRTFANLRNAGESLSFKLKDGEERVMRNTVIGVGSIVLGHKEVVHTIRHRLD